MRTTWVFLLSVAAIVAAGLCVSHEADAQSPPSDVPEIAQHEIARRGNHVEMTGTIRSGLMAAALSPPADDSAKWFLTLVLKPGEISSEKMRQVIASDPALRPWVDVREPLKSTMHYHVRSIDDATQADWLKGLRPAIARSGLPLLVLQPPKGGQFGPTSNIVAMFAGVATGEQVATRLRKAIIDYVQVIESPSGISQSVVGVSPPFTVHPKDPPPSVQPQVPFEWPPVPIDPPNPSVPAPGLTSPWLALMGLVTFAAGWMGARLKTFTFGKVAEFARAIDTLKKSLPSVPRDPPAP